MQICNILYPREGARDDEIERLDGVMLSPGRVVIDRIPYELKSLGPPEYERLWAGKVCSSVTYRWLVTRCDHAV